MERVVSYFRPRVNHVIDFHYIYYSLLDVPQATTTAVFLPCVLYVDPFYAVSVFTVRQKLNIMVHAPGTS